MPGLPADPIFISYSRRDDDVMRRIAFFLRDQGFKVWVDNEKLIPGTPTWEESIEKAINSAFAVVVVLSPDSKNSEWVRREITYADQFNKRVFPVLVKGSEEDSLPLRLVTRQYVDLRKDEETGLNALVEAIQFHIGKKQTLEMKRPTHQKQPAQGSQPTSTSKTSGVSESNVQKPFNWFLLLGTLFAVCILCTGASWIGYRALSPLLAPEQPDISTSTPTISIATSELPTSTLLPPSQEAAIPVSESDILSTYLNGVEIIHVDTFDDPSGTGWEIHNGEIKDGALQIPASPNYYGAKPAKTFKVGEGAVVDLTYSQTAEFEVYLENGDYNSSNYKRFGIFINTDVIYVNARNGKDVIGNNFSGELNMQPGSHYSVLIAILPNNEFLEVVWETNNPSQQIVDRETMDESWSSVDMVFYVGVGQGTVSVDNYREIKFSGAK